MQSAKARSAGSLRAILSASANSSTPSSASPRSSSAVRRSSTSRSPPFCVFATQPFSRTVEHELGRTRPPTAPGNDPHRLVRRQGPRLDRAQEECARPRPRGRLRVQKRLGQEDKTRLDEYLTSARTVERSIASLPPDYAQELQRPEDTGDTRDWPRVAKLQSDLLVHALASGQTRVASYMLTKCQRLTRFPWLGHTRSATTITPDLAPAGGTGHTLIAGEKGQFYAPGARRQTGKLRWEFPMPGPTLMWAGTVSTAGNVFSAHDDGDLVGLDSKAAKALWHFSMAATSRHLR